MNDKGGVIEELIAAETFVRGADGDAADLEPLTSDNPLFDEPVVLLDPVVFMRRAPVLASFGHSPLFFSSAITKG